MPQHTGTSVYAFASLVHRHVNHVTSRPFLHPLTRPSAVRNHTLSSAHLCPPSLAWEVSIPVALLGSWYWNEVPDSPSWYQYYCGGGAGIPPCKYTFWFQLLYCNSFSWILFLVQLDAAIANLISFYGSNSVVHSDLFKWGKTIWGMSPLSG